MTTDELVAILIQYPGRLVQIGSENRISGVRPMQEGGVYPDQFDADEGPCLVIEAEDG